METKRKQILDEELRRINRTIESYTEFLGQMKELKEDFKHGELINSTIRTYLEIKEKYLELIYENKSDA